MWADVDDSNAPVDMDELCELFGEVEVKKEALHAAEKEEKPKVILEQLTVGSLSVDES